MSMHEKHGAECQGTEFRGSEQILRTEIPNAISSAIFELVEHRKCSGQHRGRGERSCRVLSFNPFRVLWRHQGKRERPFRAPWQRWGTRFEHQGGPEQHFRALQQHWGEPERLLPAPGGHGDLSKSYYFRSQERPNG